MKNIPFKTILVSLWIFISVFYIWFDAYSKFKTQIIQWSYEAWISSTVSSILEKANDKECKTFDVYLWDKKATLINVECLQKAENTEK